MNDRRTEIFTNGQWVEKEFEDVEKGERFRLFEANGTRVTGKQGSTQWIAKGKPYINDDGIWELDADFDINHEIPELNYKKVSDYDYLRKVVNVLN